MRLIRTVKDKNGPRLDGADKRFSVSNEGTAYVYKITAGYETAYGFGEKFNGANQAGRIVKAAVIEKCFYQGEFTYLSMPFFLSAEGFGVFVDTYLEVVFDFTQKGEITISFEAGSKGEIADIYFFEGSPKEIIGQFKRVTAPTKLYPKWILGAWMSSNRWRRQSEIEEQLKLTTENEFPHNVIVIEPWSDLSTHYYWGGSTCALKQVDECAKASDLDFSGSQYWQNPKKLIDELHRNNIRVLLWVIPIYAKGPAVESVQNIEQRMLDNEYAVKNKDCVMNADGTPYEIPHTWNVGSMVPDFTKNNAARWINRFKHLLEMGIDGFKTDGGEFIHVPEVVFSDGTTGREGRNAYSEQYIKTFHDFIGGNRVLFSRAGGQYTPAYSITWAGDQESTWEEFRSVIKAGLSASLSGISNWGFDIAGFSGYLPSKALYARSVMAAVFAPVMQWHSDPPANGRCDFTGAWKINDRSPWNISGFHSDPEYLDMLRKHFNLHYNLIPYQYSLMLNAHKTGVPALRHLVYEFPSDPSVKNIEDEFMLGDALLVAPVLADYTTERKVYLPEGEWYDLFSGNPFKGGREYTVKLCADKIPVFFRKNKCVPLNLCGGKLFSPVGNDLSSYKELTFLISGEGKYDFSDDLGNEISVEWDGKNETVVKNIKNIKVYFLRY